MELFKIFGSIAINGVGQAENQLKSLTDKAQKGAEQMKKGFSNIGKAVGAFAVGTGAAITGFGAALVSVAESTEEYRLSMAKLKTAFEATGQSAETAKGLYQSFYGVLGDEGQATEAVAHLAELTNNQEHLSQWTTICTGIYAKFGDSLPVEGLTEAANETAKTGALTGALADALNWAGVNEDEFQAKLDECTTTQEREALIRETLNGLYTDAGNKYKENAADIIAANEAQARYTDAMAVFGEKAQPILTAVRNGFAAIMEKAGAFLEEVDMQAITDAINNAFSWFIDTAIPAIKTGVQWVIDHKDMILALVTGIGAAFLAWNVVQIVSGAITVLTSLKNTLALVKAGQLALNATMLANPIGIVIALVAALVAGFVYLWNNCEGFRNFFINMWNGIKSFFAKIVDWFKSAATSIGQFFSDAWEAIKRIWNGSVFGQYFGQVWNTIKGIFSAVKSVLSGNFSDAWEAIKGIFSGWGDFFSGLWEKVKSAFSGAVSGMANIGKDIVRGLWNGINDMVGWIVGKIQSFGENVLSGIKNFFGIASPSRVMRDEVGAQLDRGIGVGVEEHADEAVKPMRKVVSGMVSGARDISGTVAAGANYTSALAALQQKLDRLLEVIANMQLVLDTGELVGGIAPAMDTALGNIQIRRGRAQ